jgi:Ca2+-binding RTX toxin-like protein
MKPRAILFLTTVAAVLALGGVPALAVTKRCEPDRSCIGTSKDDRLIGSAGNDNMQGGRGDDKLLGRAGDDNAMRGDGGNDTLRGGPGRDHLGGGPGTDVLEGGPDFDFYFFEQGWGKEEIVDTPVLDTDINTGHQVRFDGVTDDLTIRLTSEAGPEVKNKTKSSTLDWDADLVDVVIDGKGDDTITGREVGDNIQLFYPGNNVVFALGGDDFVYSRNGGGGDVIDCGAGDKDEVRMDAGDTQVNCEVLT